MSSESDWDSIGPPPVGLFAREQVRALGALAAVGARRRLRRRVPPGDGHGVLILPGFLAGDSSTAPLRSFLRDIGYDAHGWRLGTNLGPNPELLRSLAGSVADLFQQHRRKVSLVGWSLGGIYARELARRAPERVRSVITMGSPFRDISATHAVRFIAARPGGRPLRESEQIRRALARPLPVPCTSIYSKTDGVVHWKSCLLDPGDEAENVEVHCSHTGMGFSVEVLAIVADRLALPEGTFRPYAKHTDPGAAHA